MQINSYDCRLSDFRLEIRYDASELFFTCGTLLSFRKICGTPDVNYNLRADAKDRRLSSLFSFSFIFEYLIRLVFHCLNSFYVKLDDLILNNLIRAFLNLINAKKYKVTLTNTSNVFSNKTNITEIANLKPFDLIVVLMSMHFLSFGILSVIRLSPIEKTCM